MCAARGVYRRQLRNHGSFDTPPAALNDYNTSWTVSGAKDPGFWDSFGGERGKVAMNPKDVAKELSKNLLELIQENRVKLYEMSR